VVPARVNGRYLEEVCETGVFHASLFLYRQTEDKERGQYWEDMRIVYPRWFLQISMHERAEGKAVGAGNEVSPDLHRYTGSWTAGGKKSPSIYTNKK